MAGPELPPIVFWRSADWVSLAAGESPKAFALSATERRLSESGARAGKRDRTVLEEALEQLATALLEIPGTHGGLFWLPDPPSPPGLVLRLVGIEGADIADVDTADATLVFPAEWYLEPPERARIETALGTAVRTVHRIANQDLGGKISDVITVLWWFAGLGGWMLRTQIDEPRRTAGFLPAIDQLAAGAERQ